ncbi:hypothetical protein D0B32_13655 [Paraburkholderia sp. DHOC27]|nr:hypothetical protein D0B32_13655 [Paraburkholderia sp. DHOC27]
MLVLPLCGAALTFFAAAKKVSKESGLTPLARRCPPRRSRGIGPRQDPPSHSPRSWHSSHSSHFALRASRIGPLGKSGSRSGENV